MLQLDFMTPDTSLAFPQALNSNHTLFLCKEPCVHGRIRNCKAEDAVEDRQCTREQIDVLPSSETTSGNLSKAVVQRATDDGEETGGREPPALTEGLFSLGVITTDDGHECSWNHAFDETEEESLCIESFMGFDGGSTHADTPPEDDQRWENSTHPEPLHKQSHGIQPGEHSEVE